MADLFLCLLFGNIYVYVRSVSMKKVLPTCNHTVGEKMIQQEICFYIGLQMILIDFAFNVFGIKLIISLDFSSIIPFVGCYTNISFAFNCFILVFFMNSAYYF